jgi:hypothetical protein
MKKNYFLLLVTFMVTAMSYGQVTELYFSKYGEGSANNKFYEIYNGTTATISLDTYAYATTSNGSDGNYEYWNNFPSGATIAAGDVYVIAHTTADATILAQADLTTNYMGNGDDGLALVKGGTFSDDDSDGIVGPGEMTGFTILDWIGDWGADPGSGWAVAGVSNATKDHTLTRKATVCGPNNDWDASRGTNATDSEWIVGIKNSGWSTLGSFTGCVSGPSITIISPTNGSTISNTASIDVTFTVDNFTVGASGTGADGHIAYSFNGATFVEQYTTDPITATVAGGNSYTMTIKLVDDAGADLSTAVTETTTFTVALPCDLYLTTITKTCDATTLGVDTYTATIEFTGGNTSTYTLTATAGTVGGDDPSAMASGTIIITSITEGTDIVFTAVGDNTTSSCNLTRNINSPNCAPALSFPIEETFSQTAGTNLSDDAFWVNENAGDEVVINSGSLSYTGLKASVGNSIMFDSNGSDPKLVFPTATGTVYSSFIFKLTDITAMTNANGGYFAVLGSFDARIWVKKEAAQFLVGVSNSSSGTQFTTTAYDINTEIFVVLSYNTTDGVTNLWVNPVASSFGTTEPTTTISMTDTSVASEISNFLFRQDSSSETGFFVIDELRIANSWAEVTPAATAYVGENAIDGLQIYPNPATGNVLNVRTANNGTKTITIYSVLGNKVFTTVTSDSQISLPTIKAGIYLLNVAENGQSSTMKLMIK